MPAFPQIYAGPRVLRVVTLLSSSRQTAARSSCGRNGFCMYWARARASAERMTSSSPADVSISDDECGFPLDRWCFHIRLTRAGFRPVL